MNDAGETEVTARNGEVEVFSPHGSQWVRSGQTLMARGTGNDAEFQIVAAGGPDEWDRWSDSRDSLLMQSVSSRYVGPGVYGAEDLDSAGTWSSVPEYGYVWHPTSVAADWAPYQEGRWVWEDWYGWTWVSYDPWGWAPYHYGRWFHHDRFGWCWYPGLITSRHYWSPALVGFIGFGGGGGIGFGFGNIGWVPLAPYEVFHPWWGRGYYGNRGFNRNINITNVNITNVYRNSRVHNGISAIGTNDFRNGSFHNITRTTADRIHNVGAIRGEMPFRGGAGNQRFSDRQARVIPRGTENTRFFSHQQTTAQRGGAGRNGTVGVQAGGRQNERGFGNPQQNSVAAQHAAGQSGQPNRVAQSGGEAGGWRRFGSPSNQPSAGRGIQPQMDRGNAGGQRGADRPSSSPQASQPGASRNEDRGGWQRFGSPSGRGATSPAPRQTPSTPRQEYRASPNNDRPSYGGGGSSRQESLRIAPPVVRERPSYSAPRQSAPSYSAPRQSAPSYSAPRQSAPSYSAPRQSAPSYSAPRQSAPRYSAPRQSAPSYSAPRQSAPRQSAPSYSAPRQSAPRQSAPAQRSAPRSSGGNRGRGR